MVALPRAQTHLLSLSESPSDGDRPHCAAEPQLLQRERESKVPEGLGTDWLGKAGLRLAPGEGEAL